MPSSTTAAQTSASMRASSPGATTSSLAFVWPHPILFPAALVIMPPAIVLALNGTPYVDAVPAGLREATLTHAGPYAELLFGERDGIAMQLFAFGTIVVHLIEALLVMYWLRQAATRDRLRVSWAVWVGYTVGVFAGGVTHLRRFRSALAMARGSSLQS